MVKRKILVLFILVIFGYFVPLNEVKSQLLEPHPELEWYTIETKHFIINYHKGAERTAQTIAKITEEVYGPITSLYNHEPTEKVTFKITDVSDIANGAADYYNNRMFIFASPLDYDLRGTHNWLRNVITHEFTHIIQIQSAMKLARNVPAIYFQWLDYENERRPDVLYGYPNVIVSYPIAGVGVPAWFAEGTAQYQRQQLAYDYWDSHRDMHLRMRTIGNNLLTWNEMGQFASSNSLDAEGIYNSGYNLVRYIADKYGEDKLMEISRSLGDLTNFSMDKAIRDVLGKDGDELYDEWKAYLKSDYDRRLAGVKADKIEGVLIEKEGFANYYPKFSPDGKKIAYLSNGDGDYSSTGLVIYDIKKDESELITAPAGTNFAWSPDGRKILYAKRNSPTLNYRTTYDIYEYDVKSEDEKQLTKNRRAFYPSYSRDGSMITYVVNNDGTLNLEVADKNGNNPKRLTTFNNGEQVYNPQFTPDGNSVVFDYSFEEERDIASIDISSGEMELIFDERGVDTRTPIFSKDGEKMYFASDRTGIFNIYSYDLNSKEIKQVTNVLGGAFMPSIDGNGNLTYSSFEPDGYKIALLNGFSEVDPASIAAYERPERLIPKYADIETNSGVGKNNYQWDSLKNFNDKKIPDYPTKPYSSQFTQLSFYPIVRIDNYIQDRSFLDAIKLGMYFYSDEVLGRFSIFGGATVNKQLERDLVLQFQYNNGVPFFSDFFSKTLNFHPSFNLDGYNITRKTNADLIAGIDTIDVGVEYDLLSFDFGMSFNIINLSHDLQLLYTFSKYASKLDPFVIPQSGISVRSSSEDYFKANNLALIYDFEGIQSTRNSDINPIGTEVRIQYDYEVSDINPEYEVEDDGTLISNFQTNKLHKLDVNLVQAFGLFNDMHSITLSMRGATVFGPPVDDFYNFYASGLPGMKGYPFYALGGGRVATANLTYRFPLIQNIDMRISPLYLDKLYMSVYGDFGNAWDGDNTKLDNFKKDVGAQLRLQTTSFYVFPTSIFFDAAYGLDEFTREFQGTPVTYGKEWRFYFGMLFGFDL